MRRRGRKKTRGYTEKGRIGENFRCYSLAVLLPYRGGVCSDGLVLFFSFTTVLVGRE